ncbi:MAG: hypothetical protein K0S12_173 [Bacteroidetes bacterium]|jgi:hypothetical protein|nr:hypothetical protein [Bacteroidota bacterium]
MTPAIRLLSSNTGNFNPIKLRRKKPYLEFVEKKEKIRFRPQKTSKFRF